MRAAGVVKADIAPKGGPGFRHTAIGPQIDLFIFDSSPKALEENIVPPRAFPVHSDLDPPVSQNIDKLQRGELATLIRVEGQLQAAAARKVHLTNLFSFPEPPLPFT